MSENPPKYEDQHVFAGQPDERQARSGETFAVSRFRPRYRALSVEKKALHDQIKAKAEDLETLFKLGKGGGSRYHSLAVTDLERAVMWAIKDLTS